jgi:hypothetical protein
MSDPIDMTPNEIDWESLDYDDPKALLAVLRPKYFRMLAGDAEEEISIKGETVRLARTSLPQLKKVIQELELQSGKRRQFAGVARFRNV